MTADNGSSSKQGEMLAAMCRKSMELAVAMVKYVHVREGADCLCDILAGEHLCDDDGNIFLTVVINMASCSGKHLKVPADWSGRTVLFRIVLNDNDEGRAIVEVSKDSMLVILPRLRRVSMDAPSDPTGCMM